MDPNDNELKQGLADGPLGRQDGFSDSLKKRIEKRLEEQGKLRKPRMPWLAGVGAAFALAGFLLFADWQSLFHREALQGAAERTAETVPEVQVETVSLRAEQIRSALLIGLRTDQQGPQKGEDFSTYRTLLIAPDDNRLQKIAEGPGILMPYKMNFWKIVNVRNESENEETRTLTAYPAASPPKLVRQPTLPPVKPMPLAEKLLFVGNRYMTIAQTFSDGSAKNAGAAYEYVWVKELDQLASRQRPLRTPLKEPHVSLLSIYGDAAAAPVLKRLQPALPVQPDEPKPAAALRDSAGESWAVVRKQGRWAAQLADYSGEPVGSKDRRYALKDVPLSLPESVVNHDTLAPGWTEIKRLRPSAVDAFSSPTEDMVAVVSERDIVIYPYEEGLIPTPLLTFSLGRNETVIMAQWATDDYVEQWKKLAKAFLEKE